MIYEEFAEGNSFIHRLDPRVKIGITLLYTVVIAVTSSWLIVIYGFLFACLLIGIGRLPIGRVFKRISVVLVFLALLWLLLPLSMEGRPVFFIGGIAFRRDGFLYAALITGKSLTIILIVVGLLATSELVTLFHALAHLKVPKKLVYLLFFSLRYIRVIYTEYRKIKRALTVRAFRPKTNLHTYKTYAYLVGMLLVRSYERSERIYNAMRCRGFQGTFFLLDHFSYKKSDTLFLIITIAYLSGMIWSGLNLKL